MVRVKVGDELIQTSVKARVRLDFKGNGKPGRFLFGGRASDKIAEEVREQQVAMLRNVPIQGIQVENIDMSQEVYLLPDENDHHDVAYAPVLLDLTADSVEDLLKFIAREDFRKIEILEPAEMVLNRNDLERMLFQMNEELKKFKAALERRFRNS